jgi:hypothetical protein
MCSAPTHVRFTPDSDRKSGHACSLLKASNISCLNSHFLGSFDNRTCHKPADNKPANSPPFPAAAWKSSVVRDCVVAQAVACEPVFVREFPANREKNREFSRTAGSSEQEAPMAASPRASACKFPTNKTGNYFSGTENFDRGTGNLIDQK